MSENKNPNNNNLNPSNQNLSRIFDLDDTENDPYTEEGKTFAELFETSSTSTEKLSTGNIVTGKVVSINDEHVLVDVGYKCEGAIAASEFMGADSKIDINVGDEVSAMVMRLENKQGLVTLSKEKADLNKAWDEIAEACANGDIIEGTVVKTVKSGLTVDIGVRAFLPASQLDIRPIKDLEQFVGKTLRFKVIKFNKKRHNIVLSRKAVIELEREKMRSSTIGQLKVGAVVMGNVKNITDYGAFIDLGGVDGLLHVTDMSWGRIKHPSDVLEVGQDLKLRILKMDSSKERVSLGLKQTMPDPWQDIQENYIVGQRIKGKVVSLTDYGAFVEIEDGIEGLIHVSEMSWTKKIKDPRKLLEIDADIDAVILDIDISARRLSLGLKQISPNPWETLELKYPIGTQVKGNIKNITDFGIFVEFEEGIDGLVHISDISWDEKLVHPGDAYEKGQEINAVVTSIDKENERVSLSIKLLSGDPWLNYVTENPQGKLVEGEVSKLTNFGVFVKLADKIEGMIHISELSEERIAHPEAVVKVGDKLKAEIINVDRSNRKISLSVKAIGLREEREAIDTYNESNNANKGSSLADTLDPEIAAKLGLLVKKDEGGSSSDS